MAAIKQNVSLTEESYKIVRRHAKRIGVKPLSTALNSLIIQFDELQRPAASKAETPAQPASVPEPAQPTAA